jgi:hypothetical protein
VCLFGAIHALRTMREEIEEIEGSRALIPIGGDLVLLAP